MEPWWEAEIVTAAVHGSLIILQPVDRHCCCCCCCWNRFPVTSSIFLIQQQTSSRASDVVLVHHNDGSVTTGYIYFYRPSGGRKCVFRLLTRPRSRTRNDQIGHARQKCGNSTKYTPPLLVQSFYTPGIFLERRTRRLDVKRWSGFTHSHTHSSPLR